MDTSYRYEFLFSAEDDEAADEVYECLRAAVANLVERKPDLLRFKRTHRLTAPPAAIRMEEATHFASGENAGEWVTKVYA
ncbi:MAG TPA: hypothetical protein VGL48_07790 [Acidimicrobiales bacterium]|jgi:hypothetical protein